MISFRYVDSYTKSFLILHLQLEYSTTRIAMMHSILDFCPRPVRKDLNVPQLKAYFTVLIYLVQQQHNIYSFLTLLHKPQCLLYSDARDGEPVIYLWGYLGLCPVKSNNNTCQCGKSTKSGLISVGILNVVPKPKKSLS